MKVFERLFLSTLKVQVAGFQDPLQFAYRAKIGVDDALLYMLHSVYSHLEKGSSFVRIMFFDFSSAFNTIQPHLLARKLHNMHLHPSTVSWIHDYLTDRPQHVRLQNNNTVAKSKQSHTTNRNADTTNTHTVKSPNTTHTFSNTIYTSTGAPQGTVLSPFLFTLYTADCRMSCETCHLQKFSDDSAVVGCITGEDESMYRESITQFIDWCESNFLVLNVSKTKEMVVDFRRKKSPVQPIMMKGEPIEMVDDYKYLGVVLDNKLNWASHADLVYKKIQTRLFFLRKLKSFHVCNRMLAMFYDSILCSVLMFAAVCWGGNASARDISRLNKLIKKASSTVGQSLDKFEVVLERRRAKKFKSILQYPEHPLHDTLAGLRSSFSSRFSMPKCKTERFRRSFVPSAIRYANSLKA